MPYVVNYATIPLQIILKDESFASMQNPEKTFLPEDLEEEILVSLQNPILRGVTMKGEPVWIRTEQIVSIQHLSMEKYEEIQKRNEEMMRQQASGLQDISGLPFIPGMKRGRG
jgi:hypothetical protein